MLHQTTAEGQRFQSFFSSLMLCLPKVKGVSHLSDLFVSGSLSGEQSEAAVSPSGRSLAFSFSRKHKKIPSALKEVTFHFIILITLTPSSSTLNTYDIVLTYTWSKFAD